MIQDSSARKFVRNPANFNLLIEKLGYDNAKLVVEKAALLDQKAAQATTTETPSKPTAPTETETQTQPETETPSKPETYIENIRRFNQILESDTNEVIQRETLDSLEQTGLYAEDVNAIKQTYQAYENLQTRVNDLRTQFEAATDPAIKAGLQNQLNNAETELNTYKERLIGQQNSLREKVRMATEAGKQPASFNVGITEGNFNTGVDQFEFRTIDDVFAANDSGISIAKILKNSNARKLILDPANAALLRDRFGIFMSKLIKWKAKFLEEVAKVTGKSEIKAPTEAVIKTMDKEAGKTAFFVDGENIVPEMRKVEQASRIARTEAEQRSVASDLSPPVGEANMKDGEAGKKPASSVNEKLRADKGKGIIGSKELSYTFTPESVLTKDVLKTKPTYSPNPRKWLKEGGSINIKNGVWKYTNAQKISVIYKNGYPDYKGSGLVKQEVDIGRFKNRIADFKLADKMAPLGPKRPDSTWHHCEDGRTLQEINRRIHEMFTHKGGVSINKRKE